jgi:hypothetical protein
MTISCNCQDFDGRGHIGDLRPHTFEEIFRGGKAQQFRETLARGEFSAPQEHTSTCYQESPFFNSPLVTLLYL